jgi:hypothetical protein
VTGGAKNDANAVKSPNGETSALTAQSKISQTEITTGTQTVGVKTLATTLQGVIQAGDAKQLIPNKNSGLEQPGETKIDSKALVVQPGIVIKNDAPGILARRSRQQSDSTVCVASWF